MTFASPLPFNNIIAVLIPKRECLVDDVKPTFKQHSGQPSNELKLPTFTQELIHIYVFIFTPVKEG
jgi:hypothetical protein